VNLAEKWLEFGLRKRHVVAAAAVTIAAKAAS